MRLTKDEARILAEAIGEFKYDIFKENSHPKLMENIDDLEVRLQRAGVDNRRTGRKSMDDWSDMIDRYTNKQVAADLFKE